MSGSVIEAFFREVTDTEREGYRHVVQIRVTLDAIEGSVMTAPITQERARVLGSILMTPEGVIADPGEAARMVEILVHPGDWLDVLTDASARVAMEPFGGYPTKVFGIPVVKE